jgi:hypothetical protein
MKPIWGLFWAEKQRPLTVAAMRIETCISMTCHPVKPSGCCWNECITVVLVVPSDPNLLSFIAFSRGRMSLTHRVTAPGCMGHYPISFSLRCAVCPGQCKPCGDRHFVVQHSNTPREHTRVLSLHVSIILEVSEIELCIDRDWQGWQPVVPRNWTTFLACIWLSLHIVGAFQITGNWDMTLLWLSVSLSVRWTVGCFSVNWDITHIFGGTL